jgi:xylan 1,4-beta-xylosidase
MRILLHTVVFASLLAAANPPAREAAVTADFARVIGPMDMGWFALGQGGLSEEPMFADRVPEIRALRPRIIRLFLQEYYDLMPAMGRYHWSTLDAAVETILKTGAKPLMCIAFKPKLLFPKIDQDIVEPTNWEAWEELIYQLVRRYKDRGAGIRYWEVANEPDIGEDGGCPYRFRPESYVRYYQRTARAVLRADPEARVGGPALANPNSPILPALLEAAQREQTPLHFVSWHIYSSDPLRIRQTIERTRALIAKYPSVRVETFLDEWNMSLRDPVLDPRFQPCFIAEVAWQMMEAGLDYSCYYHIRDYHIEPNTFARFMSPAGVALMTRWWNQMSQFDGLFDFQNRVRPSYFVFRLLSRLTGDRVALESSDALVHGLAGRDESLGRSSILVWNFSPSPAALTLRVAGLKSKQNGKRLVLDATAPSDDENVRLRPDGSFELAAGSAELKFALEPYGVAFLFMDEGR